MTCRFLKYDGFEAVCIWKGNKAKDKALSVQLCGGLPGYCPWAVLLRERRER